MKKAFQQIMIGSLCKSEEDIKSLLKEIKGVGYDGIELNRFMIHPTSFFVRALTKVAGMPSGNGGKYDWVKLVKEANLEVISLHTDLNSLEQSLDEVLDDAKKLNTNNIVITGMYRFPYQEESSVKELARRLNEAGKALKEKGYNLLYHNHNIELLKVNDTQTAYDLLIQETSSEFVNFEIDTYWFSEAGANPLDMMKKVGSRMKLWHVTDRGSRLDKTSMTPIIKSDSVELGCGNINLDALSDYAKEIGVEAVVLESHKNWINNNPLDSIKKSAEYLNKSFG